MSTAAHFEAIVTATGQPMKLAMQRLWLTGQVLPAGARLVVQHIFRSDEAEPLEVIYAFPLPRDAALRGFRISGEGFEAHSELKPTEAAVKTYEEGIAKGSLAALVRQYRDGVTNLTVGNIRPKETVTVHLEIICGVELRDDGLRFRFPFTLAPTYHSQAKMALTAEGEGEMELPAEQFGDVILPSFRKDASALHQVGFDLSLVGGLGLEEVGSPSHVVKVRHGAGGCSAAVSLNAEKDLPNRDLVLDARFQSVRPQVLAGRTSDGQGHFAAIVPSTAFGAASEAARRVVILLDRSGSMKGQPIAQARKAIAACLSILSDADSFGLVAFDDRSEVFQPALVAGSRAMREDAKAFLEKVDARGGTELVKGFRQAASLLDGKGGDVLILTDGQVSGTEEMLAAARNANMRLHCLGIGSASQDRFLTLLARETGGVSRFVTANERVDLTAVDLFASIGRPIAAELTAGMNIEPPPPAVVFSGTPVILFGEESEIELTWKGGSLRLPVDYSGEVGETVLLLQGSRLITDWESRYPSVDALAPLEKRKESRVAGRLLALSEKYGLASREMSLVSVVKRVGDRAGELPETRVVPVGMAQGTGFGAYFAAAAPGMAMRARAFGTANVFMRRSDQLTGSVPINVAMPSPTDSGGPGEFTQFFGGKATPPTASDTLLDLAAQIDSDGGMPGKTLEERSSAAAVALLAFLSQGHTLTNGVFRSHVAKLVAFLKAVKGLSKKHAGVIAAVIERAEKGTEAEGDWLKLARPSSGEHWVEMEKSLLSGAKRKGWLPW